MKCSKCGFENELDASFCSSCGGRFNKKRFWTIFGAVVLCAGIGLSTSYVMNETEQVEEAEEIESEVLAANIEDDQEKVDLIKKIQPRVYTIYTDDGYGSAFLFDDKGNIVTNAHVVTGFSEVTVENHLGLSTTGRVVGISKFFDVALVLVDDYVGDTPLEMMDRFVDVGTEIIAFGAPQGFVNSASIGYITGRDRALNDTGYLQELLYQVDAQISFGNSGGPLVDAKTGKVLGINTSTLMEDMSIGFSIPIHKMADQLKKWADNPMTAEAVLRVKPLDQYNNSGDGWQAADNEGPDGYYFEEVSLANYIQYFRTNFQMAVEFEDFFYIEPFLELDSGAFEQMSVYLDSIANKDLKLKLVSTTVTEVVIEDDQAIVRTNEVYEEIWNGKGATLKKDRSYLIVLDEYGYYKITSILE